MINTEGFLFYSPVLVELGPDERGSLFLRTAGSNKAACPVVLAALYIHLNRTEQRPIHPS